MSIVKAHDGCQHGEAFRHEAFFYDGLDECVEGLTTFIREAVTNEEPILVVLGQPKIDALREALNGRSESVLFADMATVGTNPARIIPAWQSFLSDHAGHGRRVRGIGEPIWDGRSAAELAECERHEALLNVAFSDPDFWLLCPYDTGALSADVIDEARRNHPFVRDRESAGPSSQFPGTHALATPFAGVLPEPPADAAVLAVDPSVLHDIRRFVSGYATDAGMAADRTADLVLAVDELATNSVLHGGGGGSLRIWREPDAIVCEVRDRGQIDDPLVGRVRPAGEATGGRGLWMTNQLCELVQIRSSEDQAAVRVHKHIL